MGGSECSICGNIIHLLDYNECSKCKWRENQESLFCPKCGSLSSPDSRGNINCRDYRCNYRGPVNPSEEPEYVFKPIDIESNVHVSDVSSEEDFTFDIDFGGNDNASDISSKEKLLPSTFGATYVYYFATIKNVAGIIRWGLFSHTHAKKLSGRDDISMKKIMRLRKPWFDYCCLYFGTHTPTQYKQPSNREEGMAFIRYNADRLFLQNGAKFSKANLASNSSRVRSASTESKFLSELEWDIIHRKSGSSEIYDRHHKAAELMIPHYIKPEAIDSIVVINDQKRQLLTATYFASKILGVNDSEYVDLLSEVSQQGVEVPSSPRQSIPPIIVDSELYDWSL